MSRFPFAGIALIVACFALPARTPADLTAASSRKAAGQLDEYPTNQELDFLRC
jgi:hypothetical protein